MSLWNRLRTLVDAKPPGDGVRLGAGWSEAAPMNVPRSGHGATVLADGRVLVCGGDEPGSAEVFEPRADLWTTTSPLSRARSWFAQSLLPDGRVLVTGGAAKDVALDLCELWDPSTGAWQSVAPLLSPRASHRACVLPDGRVLVLGGSKECGTRPDVFDPVANGWVSFPVAPIVVESPIIAPVGGGRVLLAGGFDPEQRRPSSQSWQWEAGAWTRVGNMVGDAGLSGKAVVELSDGRVLVSGGKSVSASHGGLAVSACEVFSPNTATWVRTGELLHSRGGHSALRLPDDRVLIWGGETGWYGVRASQYEDGDDPIETGPAGPPEQWDPRSGLWGLSAMPMPDLAGLEAGTTAELNDGRVLVCGGWIGSVRSTRALLWRPP